MTSAPNEPGEPRPRLEQAPGERYRRAEPDASAADGAGLDAALFPLAIVLGTAIAFTVAGGLLTVTAGLIVLAAFAGWLVGRFVSPPPRAAVVGLVAVGLGFLGIWLYGRIEGGVLWPIDYLLEVEGPVVVVLSLLAGGGMAAAASR
jgi:hypothetical protein